jgi:hypothetical protein
MKRTTEQVFAALRIEGGILPAEFLQRVSALNAPAQKEPDYDIRKGLNLKDEIGRYWRIASAIWQDYRDQRQREDRKPDAVGVRGWLVPLLTEVLGYSDLQPGTTVTIGDRRFPISHRAAAGAVPLVLTTLKFDLDRADTRFGDDGRRRAPHALIQEYLNADTTCLWGFVGNGTTLRLVRNSPSLTRPAYVEVDLERMFEEQLFSDFAAFWLLFHASRLTPRDGKIAACVLEIWRLEGQKTGERALANLRTGVTTALRELGSGFVQHPANTVLRVRLKTGEVTPQAYFQELLRLVYRLLFLFAAEERDLLLDTNGTADAKELYRRGYSLARLRDRARLRRNYDGYSDLWLGLQITFRGLISGTPALSLPALGGLFADDQCVLLENAALLNDRLLAAIHALGFFPSGATLSRVNYRDMGTEELGSVYESLLELHPVIMVDAAPWSFGFAGDEVLGGTTRGAERKLSGSYYTPDTLVQELLRVALDPIIERTLRENPSDPRGALLRLTVVDPACGSGHFLLGAARRLASEVARLDAQSDVPDETRRRRALREVVRRCIFGVDRNPLSVELCKTALWIEAIEPGKPLTFLDSHIKCGDSLIGVADLSILKAGIPDDAFKELEGDDKAYTRDLRRRNKEQRDGKRGEEGQLRLPLVTMPPDLAAAVASLTDAPEDTVAQVEEKRRRFRDLQSGRAGFDLRIACNIWTAAFMLRKNEPPERPGRDLIPTTDALWGYLRAPSAVYGPLVAVIDEVATKLRFFHWPLEFPEVTVQGGFDLILGNPPWETMSPDAKEWFAPLDPTIADLAPEPQAERIAEILLTPTIKAAWDSHCDFLYRAANFMRNSGRYRLFAAGSLGKGDFNVWRMFCELALNYTKPGGFASQLLPENFYNGSNAAAIRAEILTEFSLRVLISLKNSNRIWFPAVHAQTNFALYAAEKGLHSDEILVVFGVNSIEKLLSLRDGNLIRLPVALIHEFSPDALAIADVAHAADIAIVRKMYARLPKFGAELAHAPKRKYMREVDMGNDREDFGDDPDGVPLYQGSMVSHFDHRSQAYLSGHGRRTVWRDLRFGSSDKAITPQWHLARDDIPAKLGSRWHQYRIGFCDIANPLNQRTFMSTIIPPEAVCGHTVPSIIFEPNDHLVALLWLGVANSLCIDFLVRRKVTMHMTLSIVDSLPLPRLWEATTLDKAIASRTLRLAATGTEMLSFWQENAALVDIDVTRTSPVENPVEREQLRVELDVLVARDLFGLNIDEMRYLLDPTDILGSDCGFESFGALKRAECRDFGEFRTRRLILEAWEHCGSERS